MNSEKEIIKDDEIDIFNLFSRLWSDKVFILLTSFIIATIGAIYSLMLPNVFMSVAKLGPSESYQTAGSGGQFNSGGLGGLAALAGINLNTSSSTVSSVQLAVETARSKDFYRHHVQKRNLLPALLFIEDYDPNKNEIIYNESYYDVKNDTWPNGKPNIDSGYKILHTNFGLSQDRRTGVITMTMRGMHPELTRMMLENFIDDLNDYLKEKDTKDAKAALDYLVRQAEQTGSPDMKKGLISLALQKSSVLMVSEISEQYALTYIDSADAPLERISPRRTIIVIIFGAIGFLICCVLSLLFPSLVSKLRFRKA